MRECPKCGLPGEFYQSKSHWCKECCKAYQREWHAKNKTKPGFKDKRKDSELRWRYGISLEQREIMLEGQGYQCDICFVEIDSKAHTDHDHKTGKVRGVLCTNCNRALGHFKEDKTIIQAAIDYLERHK